MYAFSKDEQHLYFLDCFGLTRLSLPDDVKSDTAIVGSRCSTLSLSRDDQTMVTWDDADDSTVVWSVPALEPKKRFPRFTRSRAWAHPDGGVVAEGVLHELAKGVVLPHRTDRPNRASEKIRDLVIENDSPKEEEVRFGGGLPQVPIRLRIHHSGAVVSMESDSALVGNLKDNVLHVQRQFKVTADENARLDLFVDSDDLVFLCHLVGRFAVRSASGRFELESLGYPVRAGPWLAYQPAEDRVVRRNLKTGAEETFQVAGLGTLFLGEKESFFFLPSHRESVIDLKTNNEVDRGLPADTRDVRQVVLGAFLPIEAKAIQLGCDLSLGQVETRDGRISFRTSVSGTDSLAGALLGSMASDAVAHCKLPEGWSYGGYGSRGGISAPEEITMDDLTKALEIVPATGATWLNTAGFWRGSFDSPLENSDEEVKQALLKLMTAALANNDLPVIPKGIPSAEQIISAVESYEDRHNLYDAKEVMGLLVRELLDNDAADQIEEVWNRY